MATGLKVTLELDDKGFITGIKAATDQTNKLKDAATQGTTAAGQGFANLTSKVEGLSSKMSGLITVLLGAGFVEFGRKALGAADNVVDLSNATDVSIPKILQLKDAFQANGGSAEGLSKILNKLSNSLYDAREGGAVAQENLIKLGFTMKDIANLNTEQAMAKTIDKLAEMTDPIERNALAFRVFGKEAKNIDWDGIRAGTTGATDEYNKMAASQKAAADAHDKLTAASDKLTIAFANMLNKTGVLDFINNMDTNMQKFEKTVTIAAGAMAAFISTQVLMGVVALGKAILDLEKGIIAVGVALKLLEQGNMFTRLASLAVTLGAAAGAYLGLTKMLDEATKGPGAGAGRGDGAAELAQRKKDAEAAAAATKEKPGVVPYWEKELVGIRQVTAEYQKNENILAARLRRATALIANGEDQIAITTATTAVTERYNQVLDDLNKKRDILAASPQSTGRDAQIAEIDKQRVAIAAMYETSFEGALRDTKNSNDAISRDKIRLVLLSDQISLQERLTALQAETAMIGLTSIEKKYYAIDAAAKKAAESEIRAEEQRRFGENAGKTPQFSLSEEAKKQITDAATERAKKEKEAAQATYDSQRTFASGWKDAFASYAENATNAAEQAKSMFQRVTSSFEDLIVNFVKTGKLNFKDFANSVIEQFVRIQAQKLALGIFGGSGTSDIFSTLLGKATGGPVDAMTPYMVGERGPELFVPRSAGTIVPNNALTGSTNITYNITATDAASFRQMIARDPEFIYAVTEKGRSSVPGSRR